MGGAATKIWLASYPRSGNTYARLLLQHHFGIDALPEWGREPGQEFYECELTSTLNTRRGSRVYTMKTHSLVKDGSPAIVLVRDGRDALVSNAHAQKDLWKAQGSFAELLARRMDPNDVLGWREVAGFSIAAPIAVAHSADWSAFYEHWLSGVRGPTRLVRYEDLVRRPLAVIWDALAGVLGRLVVPHALEPLPPFSEFQRQRPGFFRSGVIGAWKDEMSPELEAKFWLHHGPMMTRLGYQR